jgi:hypothetical protein
MPSWQASRASDSRAGLAKIDLKPLPGARADAGDLTAAFDFSQP